MPHCPEYCWGHCPEYWEQPVENTALEPRRPRRLVLGRGGPGLRGRHPQEHPQLSGPRLRAHELAHEVPPGALRLLRRQFLVMEYAHCKTPSLYVPVLCSLVAHVFVPGAPPGPRPLEDREVPVHCSVLARKLCSLASKVSDIF